MYKKFDVCRKMMYNPIGTLRNKMNSKRHRQKMPAAENTWLELVLGGKNKYGSKKSIFNNKGSS